MKKYAVVLAIIMWASAVMASTPAPQPGSEANASAGASSFSASSATAIGQGGSAHAYGGSQERDSLAGKEEGR